MAGESVQLLELLVDSSSAVTDTDKLIGPLERVATAANKAAESVTLLGSALDRAGDQSRQMAGIENLTRAQAAQADAARAAAAAGEQTGAALTRQETAAQSSAAVIARLTTTLRQATAAQLDMMQVGNPTSGEWITTYEKRISQLKLAIAELNGGASVESVMARFPQAFEAAARGAQQASSSFIVTARSTQELTEALMPLEAAFARARASFTSLTEKYSPATASAQLMTRELAQLNEAQRAGFIVGEQYAAMWGRIVNAQDLGAKAAQQAAEAQARLNAEARATQNALNTQQLWNIGTGVERPANIGGGLGTGLGANGFPIETAAQSGAAFQQHLALADAAQKVRDQLDPAAAAFAKYNAQVAQYGTMLRTIDPDTKKSLLSQEEYNKAVSMAADEHQGAVASLHQMGTAVDSTNDKVKESTKQHILNRNGMMELRAAGVNAFQALSAGMNPLFVAQMEGAQVVGAVVQGTNITLGQVLATLGPIVAFSAAIALIVLREHEAEASLRSFNLQLSTVALTADGPTAASLRSLQLHLRDTGSSAADAKKMIDTVLQATPRGLNPNAAGTIIPLARDIAAATGADPADVTQKLTGALTGGVDAMIKYGFEVGALSAPQAILMRQMEEQGHAADAMRIGIQALSDVYGGTFARSLTESQKLMLGLKDAWNTLMDTLAEVGILHALTAALTGVANALKEMAVPLQPGFVKSAIDAVKDMAVPVKPFFGGSTTGSNVASLDTRGLDVNSESLQRLTTVIGEGSKALPAGYSVIATSTTGGTHTPGSLHYGGDAIDIQIVGPDGKITNRGADTTGYYSTLAAETYLANQRMFPGTPLAWGGNFGVTPGSNVADLMHFDAGQQRGSLGIPLPELARIRAGLSTGTSTSATAADASRSTTAPDVLADQQKLIKTTEDQKKAVDDVADADRKALIVKGQVGAANRLAAADLDAQNRATQMGLKDDLRINFLREQHANALAIISTENKIAADSEKLYADGTIKTAEAYQRSTVEGLRAAAATQAVAQSRSGVISVEQAYNQILVKNAVDAIAAGAAQARAMNPVIEGNARVAEATLRGAAAQHIAEITNDAIAKSQDAVNKAQATGIQSLIDLAQATEATNIKQALANETLKQTTALRASINQSKDQVEAVQLEISLQGQPREVIAAQLTLLKEQQRIKNDLSLTSKEDQDAALQQAVSLANANIALAEAQRQTQRINQAMEQVGQTIDSALTQRISDAFDGKKAESWGDTMRSILKSLLTQIAEFAFIRPLIGTALGALGFGQAAQSFGSFGSILGIGGAGAAGVAGAAGGGGGGIGNLLQVGGLAKDAFGGGSLFGEGGFSGFLNNIGGNLGFGTPLTGAGGLSAAELQGLGFPAVSPGSLFGSTTIGTALGGIGIGAGAGGLIASLTGGNPILGSVGGGIGGLGGNLLAGALGLSLGPLGGILGGVLGGAMGSLFGPAKSTFASGASVDLLTGKVGDFSSSGNQQNDQQVKQISKSLGDFSASVQKLTGGTTDGSINVVATTKGIETHYSGSLGKIDAKFADAESAINGIELALAQNLTGVSDTMKTALAHMTDPSQVQAIVTFAATYDDLKKAMDSAFSSISTDVKTVGPFQTALENLNKQFKDIGDQATQFGLSLDPVNAGLAAATTRLQSDFGKSLDQAINGGTGNDSVNQLIKVSQDFAANTREAVAIGLGGDATTTGKISQLETLQAQGILSGLSGDQLQKVVDSLGQSNPEIAAMAQAILNTGLSATGATVALRGTADALKALSAGVKSIEDLALSLKTGQLSGLTPAAASAAANAAYQTQYQSVLSAGKNVSGDQLTDLSKLGQSAIEASRTAYGEGPQTADLRKGILTGLDYVTGQTGSSASLAAQATNASASSLLTGSPAVQAAQAAAALAAAAGVTSKLQGAFAGGSDSTPPGLIMVGEGGPELVYQRGGLSITPISAHPNWSWRGGAGGSSGDNNEMLSMLRAIHAELTVHGEQRRAVAKETISQTGLLTSIDKKTTASATAPVMRQKLTGTR